METEDKKTTVEGIWNKIDSGFNALNPVDHIDWNDHLGWETLGKRFSEQTIGKEWREGQMQDIWNTVPKSWRPNIAKTAMSAAEGFGNYWQGARTINNKYNPLEYAEAGTARVLEGVGWGFEGISQIISKGTGLDIELARIATDFVPIGGAVKRGATLTRRAWLANKLKKLDAVTAKRVVDFANKIEPSLDPLKKYTLLADEFPQISLAEEAGFLHKLGMGINYPSNIAMFDRGKPSLIQSTVQEYQEWARNISYEGHLKQLRFNIDDPNSLIEPGRKLSNFMGKNQILGKFKDNAGFQAEVAQYLNMAYWWKTLNKSGGKKASMKGFPLGTTIEAPDGTLYKFKDGRFANKSKVDELIRVRKRITKIDPDKIRALFWNELVHKGVDPLTSLDLAQQYLEMNNSLTRHLIKRMKEINAASVAKGGSEVVSIDHIYPVAKWRGEVGANVYYNLMLMDISTNKRIGAKQKWINSKGERTRYPIEVGTALGAPTGIVEDIRIWLDKFGPGGSGELWGFFRDLPTEQRKIIWNAVINRGIDVNDALESLKFGDKFIQGTLF